MFTFLNTGMYFLFFFQQGSIIGNNIIKPLAMVNLFKEVKIYMFSSIVPLDSFFF